MLQFAVFPLWNFIPKFISFGQKYIAWATSSLCDLQKSQVASVITFRLTRFVFEGRESQHALHTKFFNLAGRLSFQIACQKCFTASGFKEPGCWYWCSFCRNLYPDFTVYYLDGLWGLIRVSCCWVWHKGIALIESALKSSSSPEFPPSTCNFQIQ